MTQAGRDPQRSWLFGCSAWAVIVLIAVVLTAPGSLNNGMGLSLQAVSGMLTLIGVSFMYLGGLGPTSRGVRWTGGVITVADGVVLVGAIWSAVGHF